MWVVLCFPLCHLHGCWKRVIQPACLTAVFARVRIRVPGSRPRADTFLEKHACRVAGSVTLAVRRRVAATIREDEVGHASGVTCTPPVCEATWAWASAVATKDKATPPRGRDGEQPAPPCPTAKRCSEEDLGSELYLVPSF